MTQPRLRPRAVARSLACAAFLALAAAPGIASAQGGEDRSGQADYELGVHLYDEGKFSDAAQAFERAYGKDHDPRRLWNLALAQYRAGLLFAALGSFRRCVNDPLTSPTKLDRAKKLIAELEPKMTHVAVTTDAGAAIFVDDIDVGTAPRAPIELDPALPHVVRVSIGTREAQRDLPPLGAGEFPVTLPLPAAAPASPPPSSSPLVVPPPSLPPTNTTRTDDAPRTHTSVVRWVVAGSLGASALVAAGIGIGFAVSSKNDGDDAATLRQGIPVDGCPSYPHCADLKNAVDAENSDATTARWMYGAAAVLGASAVLTFVLLPSTVRDERRSKATLSVTPILDPTRRTLGVRGAF